MTHEQQPFHALLIEKASNNHPPIKAKPPKGVTAPKASGMERKMSRVANMYRLPLNKTHPIRKNILARFSLLAYTLFEVTNAAEIKMAKA
jgi:hypothetical protein